MKHIFPPYAYSDAPRAQCWWDHTCAQPTFETLDVDHVVDVAVIGGGFTGLSAALELARSGASVCVLEANHIGWGASGRNGGFCCLGGGTISDAMLDRRYGRTERLAYRQTELAAVNRVDKVIRNLDLDVDRHSQGETELAHRPKDYLSFQAAQTRYLENYNVSPTLIAQNDLAAFGLNGRFFGAMTVPAGFALNPLKYVRGLAQAVVASGGMIYEQADVQPLERSGGSWLLQVGAHKITADQVVIATNGYSSETLAPWLAGRYLPVQSNVIVTRPLTEDELQAQGWHSDQMAFDSRRLLHYFRLMPNNRMLFGLRGGLLSNPKAQRRASHAACRDFAALFPAWSDVDITHSWSGMAALAYNQTPYVGEIDDAPGLWASLCYHGNGVAMGSYAGASIGRIMSGQGGLADLPKPITQPMKHFPFGAMRRALMPLAYAGLMLADL